MCVFFLPVDSFSVETVDEYNNVSGRDVPVVNDLENWNGTLLVDVRFIPDDSAARQEQIQNICSIGSEDLKHIVFIDAIGHTIAFDLYYESVTVVMTAQSGLAAKSDRFEYVPYGEYNIKTYAIFVDHVTRADKQVLDKWPGNVTINLVYYDKKGQSDDNVIAALQGGRPDSTFIKIGVVPAHFPQ